MQYIRSVFVFVFYELEKLMKAGANILMPVVVGEGRRCAVGTAVDYAHYAFHQVQYQHNCTILQTLNSETDTL